MSSDTTILVVKSGDEHYIGVVHAVQNITDHGNQEAIRSFMRNCIQKGNYVKGSIDEALDMAESIGKEWEGEMEMRIEYGIEIYRINPRNHANFAAEARASL